MSNLTKNYHFVVATPLSKQEFEEKSQFCLFLDKTNEIKNSTIIYNNKKGLSEIYNTFITEENRNKNIIFVHDDVLIEDLFYIEKINLAFEKYDIIGLAGSKKCKINTQTPPAWHLMSDRNDFVGEVGHSKDKICWTTVFGPTNSRALLIDGLFIGVKVDKLLDSNLKFDENFKFHHYDITFCLNANSNKLKLGVFPLRVVHYGLGDSMNTQEWNDSASTFNKLYNK
jgi:hypothetical protein